MEWIRVEDELPSERGRYLVNLNAGPVVICRFYDNKWYENSEFITDWMPLPEKPKER